MPCRCRSSFSLELVKGCDHSVFIPSTRLLTPCFSRLLSESSPTTDIIVIGLVLRLPPENQSVFSGILRINILILCSLNGVMHKMHPPVRSSPDLWVDVYFYRDPSVRCTYSSPVAHVEDDCPAVHHNASYEKK